MTINGEKAIRMPQKGYNILKFKNYHKQMSAPFVIYADFESVTKKIGTLSNLDDEPSGRRPEVFSRSRQLLRMSVMSPTWRSGRDNC